MRDDLKFFGGIATFGAALAFIIAAIVECASGCTPQARGIALSANQALCAVPHVLRGKLADEVAMICGIELPIAQALVDEAGDAGAKP